MKTVYFVRHGESEANIGGLNLGPETKLTDTGREQAAFIGKRLLHIPVDVVVASTFLRARETAEIIVQTIQKPIDHSDLFIEWKQGAHRIGKNGSDPVLTAETKDLIDHLHESDRRIRDEENFSDLSDRAEEALQYLIARPEAHVVVVTHAWFLTVLLGKAVMGEDFTGRDCQHIMKAFRMKNTGLSVLIHGNPKYSWHPWSVVTWNDHAHLG